MNDSARINPWDTLTLIDHLDEHRRRLYAFAELSEAPPDAPLWAWEVLPRLILEEAMRAEAIERVVRRELEVHDLTPEVDPCRA